MSDYVVDIDGTIADIEHRRHWVQNHPKNWKAFNKSMNLDLVIEPVAQMVRELYVAGHNIILCSGRGGENRNVTEEWLNDNNIPWNALYMRKEGDYRKDSIIKDELHAQIIEDGYWPTLYIDDRDQVVEMIRARGDICLQVAPGDF